MTLKYFKPSEFVMGTKNVYDNMDKDFLLLLDKLRDKVQSSINILSSYRDAAYNKKIGGVSNSFHLTGRAVDISCPTSEYRALVIKEALNLGFSVGIMNTALHLDNRSNQVLFHYYPRYGSNNIEQKLNG